jgi:hypothetical protein
MSPRPTGAVLYSLYLRHFRTDDSDPAGSQRTYPRQDALAKRGIFCADSVLLFVGLLVAATECVRRYKVWPVVTSNLACNNIYSNVLRVDQSSSC